ncbi:MAG: sensor domain-containing diguanylate cyclase [Kaiparowitsia implicata GSE-PSE-MK54-09C]|jgi:diguanylate cyclase (GGDEF)-like protein|nr:sensor domain-containing diguanylate cyclase [Kaiparowitsia implicata GSE-PSE-MK54-09C]
MRAINSAGGLAVAVIDALTSHICVLDEGGTIIAVNRAWREYGEGANKARPSDIGLNYLDVCHGAVGNGASEALAFYEGIRSVLDGKLAYFQLEYPCHSPTEERWYLARVSPLFLDQDQRDVGALSLSGAVVSHANITEQKALESKLAKMAATDGLTGLLNRRAFVEAAGATMADLHITSRPAALLMFDVDHFKLINDTYGHQAGDQALQAIAATCRSVLRASDLVARIGGEEFACFMPDTDTVNAAMLAERLRQKVAALAIPPMASRVTISVGIANMPASGVTLDNLLTSADRAMYLAKRDGRNRVRPDTLGG